MLCDYLFDMACLCEYVFICFRILCLGLEHVLISCLIEFRSFRLLTHKVSSPNKLTMLLFVLICCVVFIVGFRDDISTIFQIWVVVVVREGVTVRNPKTDSKSEVGCSRYGATNRGSTREMCKSRVATWPARVGGRGPHGQGSLLLPWAPRALNVHKWS